MFVALCVIMRYCGLLVMLVVKGLLDWWLQLCFRRDGFGALL